MVFGISSELSPETLPGTHLLRNPGILLHSSPVLMGMFNLFHCDYLPEDVNKIVWRSVLFPSSFCELQRMLTLLKAVQTSSAQDERPQLNVQLSLLNLSSKTTVDLATGTPLKIQKALVRKWKLWLLKGLAWFSTHLCISNYLLILMVWEILKTQLFVLLLG